MRSNKTLKSFYCIMPPSHNSIGMEYLNKLAEYVRDFHNGRMASNNLSLFYSICPESRQYISKRQIQACNHPFLRWEVDSRLDILVYVEPIAPILDEDTLSYTDSVSSDEESVNTDIIPNRMLLLNYPLGTTRYFQFDQDGSPALSEEPFADSSSHILEHNALSDDLDRLAAILPPRINREFQQFPLRDYTTEIILDIGRRPLLRYMVPDTQRESGGNNKVICSGELNCSEVTIDELMEICEHETLGKFTSDNRSGISQTLHRISRKLNRSDEVIALTLRVGRMVPGSTRMISDIVNRHDSVLLLGVPGVGKTTLLREYARVLADKDHRVEIVDTSNEIAGDGDVPHISVGRSRRMMVNVRSEQHAVMIEAVQNHMPNTVIVDEIGTRMEASAAGDIAQRGVKVGLKIWYPATPH